MTSPLTKNQWIGILVMIAIIGIVIGSFYVTNHFFRPTRLVHSELDTLTLRQIIVLEKQGRYYPKTHYNRIKEDTIPLYLHQFDPNTADSIELLQLGFKPWMVRNMLRYREKNGVWRTKESLKRVYGMTDDLYEQIEPYVVIVETDTATLQNIVYQEKKDTILNLNTCDTAELKYLRGVGSYYARRIVQYRNMLGGYVSAEQLYEIEKLPDTTVDSIIFHFIVNSDEIHRIDVNHSSVERLARHPYLSFAQAKAIYTLRRTRFRLQSIDDLYDIDCLTETDINRLEPYLSFLVNDK